MNNTIAMLKVGDYFHEFTPSFSWLVAGVLVLILLVAYYIGKSETIVSNVTNPKVYKGIVKKIVQNDAYISLDELPSICGKLNIAQIPGKHQKITEVLREGQEVHVRIEERRDFDYILSMKNLKRTFTVRYASTWTRVAYSVLAYIVSMVLIMREHGNGILQWEYNHAGSAADEGIVFFATLVFIAVGAGIYAFIVYKVFGLGIKMSIALNEIMIKRMNGVIAPTEHLDIIRTLSATRSTAKRKSVAKKPSVPARKVSRVATRAVKAV